MRHALLSGVAALCLVSGSAVFNPSYAQKGSVLKPAGGWAVTKMDGSGGAYCTMSRRYEYNTILSMARNLKAESTFAVDFQRPILKSAETLDVTLDPGAGVVRRMSVQPVSNQAFVAKLGKDDEFFSALEKTGFLRVVVGEQSYNFNISDFDGGENKLAGCVNALPVPMPATPPAPVVSEAYGHGDQYTSEIAALRERLDVMEADNRALSSQLSQQRPVMREAPEVSALTPSAPVAPPAPPPAEIIERVVPDPAQAQKINTLSAELARLRSENVGIKAELSAAQASSARPDPAIQAQLSSLESQNRELRQQLEISAMRQQEQVSSAQNRLKEKENEVSSLNQTQRSAMNALNAEVEKLRAENQAQAQEIVRISQQSVQIEELRQRSASLENENSSLRQKLASANGDSAIVAQLQNQIAALENEKIDYKRLLDEAKSSSVNAEPKIAALHAENARLKQDLHDTRIAMETMRTRLAFLESEQSGMQQLASTTEQERSRVQQVQSELQAEIQAKDARVNTLSDTLREKEGQVAALSRRLEQQGEVLSSLSSENAHLKSRVEKAEVDVMAAREAQDVMEAQNVRQYEPSSGQGEDVQSVATEVSHVAKSVLPAVDPDVSQPAQNDIGIEEVAYQADTSLTAAQNLERQMKHERKASAPIEVSEQLASMPEVEKLSPPPLPMEAEPISEPVAQDYDAEPAVARSSHPEPSYDLKPAQSLPVIAAPALTLQVEDLISDAGQVRPELVADASNEMQKIYQWQNEGLYGSAEQHVLQQGQEFDDMVLSYLTRAQERCNGDFAVVPSGTEDYGMMRVDSYEVACVGDAVDSSAALIFVSADNSFNVIAHEGPSEALTNAIDSRERVFNTLMRGV